MRVRITHGVTDQGGRGSRRSRVRRAAAAANCSRARALVTNTRVTNTPAVGYGDAAYPRPASHRRDRAALTVGIGIAIMDLVGSQWQFQLFVPPDSVGMGP
ncbi:hypothetical protein KRM28CT15_46010 [Krasilnikovia sp. M28-CT-15]